MKRGGEWGLAEGFEGVVRFQQCGANRIMAQTVARYSESVYISTSQII